MDKVLVGGGGKNRREGRVDFGRNHRKLGISPAQKRHQIGQEAARPLCGIYRPSMVSRDNR